MFGYIDPGTGSLVIQAIIAAMVGTGFYFRRFFIEPVSSAWRFVSRQKPSEETAADQAKEALLPKNPPNPPQFHRM